VVDRKTVVSWLYASRSVLPEGQEQTVVRQIVDVSRVKNGKLAITGALIFTGSFFAQYIEGPPEGVESLKASIPADVRHIEVRTVAAETVQARKFGDWSLAYSAESAPFDRLTSLAHRRPGRGGQALLMEMIRRFKADDGLR
jgi:lipase chaperone LimK